LGGRVLDGELQIGQTGIIGVAVRWADDDDGDGPSMRKRAELADLHCDIPVLGVREEEKPQ
jgi:hypothetical protein